MRSVFLRRNPPIELQIFLGNEEEVLANKSSIKGWSAYMVDLIEAWELMTPDDRQLVRDMVELDLTADEIFPLFLPYLNDNTEPPTEDT